MTERIIVGADGRRYITHEPEQKKEWIGLTEAEIIYATDGLECLLDCARAIEAKLREKNGL